MGLLVTAQELAADESARVFDCRFHLTDKTLGQRLYDEGHIPNAHFAHLEKHLSSAPGEGGRHPLPDRDTLARQLRVWGVNDDSKVVCYDQNNGAFAARLWWLLRWLGHDNVYVLDGGLDAWIGLGKALSQDLPDTKPGSFTVRNPLAKTIEADELLKGHHNLIDARDPERFRGEAEPIDPIAGHIPGAVCLPFAENLSDGTFKSITDLQTRFSELDSEKESVCYCGSGVTATHNILAMLLAGHSEPYLYPGSWSGWITDPSRPVATGS